MGKVRGASQALDSVNHPGHYNTGSVEVIDYIEDQKLSFHLGNAIKYISRAGKKDSARTVEDLEKAVWYINRYINLLRSEKQEQNEQCEQQEEEQE